MNWAPTNDAHGSVIDKDGAFSAAFNPSKEQVTVSNSHTWIVINAAPSYFGRPNPAGVSLAVRTAGDGYEMGNGAFDEALEIVREIASEPGVDLDMLSRVLRNVMDPLELMAFHRIDPHTRVLTAPKFC